MTTRRDFLKNLAGFVGLALTSGAVGATMKGVASDIVPALPPSVPALLTPGEYVISREFAEKYGMRLTQINELIKLDSGPMLPTTPTQYTLENNYSIVNTPADRVAYDDAGDAGFYKPSVVREPSLVRKPSNPDDEVYTYMKFATHRAGEPNKNGDVFPASDPSDHEIIVGLDTKTGDVCEYESDGSFAAHITNIKISADLGREEINELGRRGPYNRFVKFPIETTEEIK